MLPASVTPDLVHAEALGIVGPLTVTRIWPRTPGRLSLELHGQGGQLLAGQMIDDDGDRRRIMAATSRRARAGEHVLLAPAADGDGAHVGTALVQAHGADRRLKALPHLLTEPASRLVVHRPERRAVVFQPGWAGGRRWCRSAGPGLRR